MTAPLHFVTGATGFLGGHFVSVLSRRRAGDQLCLIRPTERQTAVKRLSGLVAAIAEEDRNGRIDALSGQLADLSDPPPEMDVDALAERVTRIWHFAAEVNFTLPLDAARRANVAGTRSVLDFAQRCARRNRNFEGLCYVSTAYVAGRRGRQVAENSIAVRPRFRNTYEQSKSEAEQLVRAAGDAFPTVIVRPSIIAGRTLDGRMSKSNPLALVAKHLLRRRVRWVIADHDAKLDFVDAPSVAEAIYIVGSEPSLVGRAVHLCAGEEGNLSVAELREIARDALGLDLRFLPHRVYPLIARPLLAVSRADASGALRKFFDAYGSYFARGPEFETRFLPELLARSGQTWPTARQVVQTAFSDLRARDDARGVRP